MSRKAIFSVWETMVSPLMSKRGMMTVFLFRCPTGRAARELPFSVKYNLISLSKINWHFICPHGKINVWSGLIIQLTDCQHHKKCKGKKMTKNDVKLILLLSKWQSPPATPCPCAYPVPWSFAGMSDFKKIFFAFFKNVIFNLNLNTFTFLENASQPHITCHVRKVNMLLNKHFNVISHLLFCHRWALPVRNPDIMNPQHICTHNKCNENCTILSLINTG